MNEKPRFIQGTPALLLLVGTGGAVLVIALRRLTEEPTPIALGAFIAGLACGYVPPLTIRLARMLGRDRMERTRWLRLLFLLLFFAPLLTALVALAVAPVRLAQVFGMGTLAMVLLGLGLQDDGPPALG